MGQYTQQNLLDNGCLVDVICLEEYKSDNELLHYCKANADINYLTDFLADKFYDGIVNFIHYKSLDEYKPIHTLLSAKTKHPVFLSSYRVYADSKEAITEDSPLLFDTVKDENFLQTEDYAVPKSKCEKWIKTESNTNNRTIVRPVISSSDKRLDIISATRRDVITAAQNGYKIKLPLQCRELVAGLDWAGNSGRLIANLVINDKAFGETYTVSSAQNLKWDEVAQLYTELLGVEFEWVDMYKLYGSTDEELPYWLRYDRGFNRKIDNSKILAVTDYTEKDFLPFREGIKIELDKIKKEQKTLSEKMFL